MESRRAPAAARSAAVLGSRNARRQLRFVLSAASEAGAYSVGFNTARGALTGFSVYFAGDFAGAGKSQSSAAAFTCAAPHPSHDAMNVHALPTARTPAAAAAAPATPAAARKRGCRAGAKVQLRRHGACGRATTATTAATLAAPLEGGATTAQPYRHTRTATREPAAPLVPPPHTNRTSSALPPHNVASTLSPLAPAYAPSPPPSSPQSSALPQEEEDPLSYPADLRHLLPHARFSFEERRWD